MSQSDKPIHPMMRVMVALPIRRAGKEALVLRLL
jgi:hypothetical protein